MVKQNSSYNKEESNLKDLKFMMKYLDNNDHKITNNSNLYENNTYKDNKIDENNNILGINLKGKTIISHENNFS